MKNRLKNGFTLVELLVTIVLLGVVGAIVIYNMTSVTSESKESDYDRFIATVRSAAQVYADNNPDAFNELYTTKAFVYFTIGDLIQSGLLDEGLINPYTEERVGQKEKIKANLDSVEGGLFFEYPLESSEEETFLVAVSDYIHWGEPYDCMQGQGSYQLSLATEEGERIDLTAENIEKYQVECSLPEDVFKKQEKTVDGVKKVYYSTEDSGNYDVTYKWVTESGTRKSAKRTLRVLPKLEPTFAVSIGNESSQTPYDYDFTSSPVYEPTYNTSTNTWNGLWITALIEGADSVDIKYTVSKRTVKPTTGSYETVVSNSSSYTPIQVDDGYNHYKIEATIYGHHDKDYSYRAGESKEHLIKQELVIPSTFVSGASSSWTYNKTFNISDTYSPVGVAKYEYYISNTSAPSNLNSLAVEPAHVFTRVKGVTSKSISVINNSCTRALNEYKYIFFRAINEKGYVGKWTPVFTANLTNHLSKLITTESDSCSNCNTCCVKESSNCYYCDDIRYVDFGRKRFVLLEKYSNNSILAAFDGVSDNKVIPTAIKTGTYTVVTCDGTYTETYKYSSPVIENIISEGNSILSALPSNYPLFLNYKTWSSGYSSYVGTVNRTIYNKYKTALYESVPYWTTDTYGSSQLIYATSPYNHGNYTTRDNVYFYSIEAGVLTQKYAGNYAYVKPLVEFNSNIYVCGGSGTSASPYVIATK